MVANFSLNLKRVVRTELKSRVRAMCTFVSLSERKIHRRKILSDKKVRPQEQADDQKVVRTSLKKKNFWFLLSDRQSRILPIQ